MLASERRLWWALGAAFQVFAIAAYLNVAPTRTPPFEAWGIALAGRPRLREPRDLATANEPRLALLTGRRRIGKTYLLLSTWDERRAFVFTAARTSPELNRQQLLADLVRWSGEPIDPDDHPTWRSVFNLLLDLRVPEPLVVVLDEFQYLADDERGLASVAS